MSDLSPPLCRAYEHCARLARDHYENFPVASRLLPEVMRQPVAAVYAFARAAADFADEGVRSASERLALLDDWQRRLHQAVDGPASTTVDDDDQLIFLALGHTIRAHALPLDLFDDLLSAFRQDATVRRYETWAELLDYCTLSANPVGELVLHLAGAATPERLGP